MNRVIAACTLGAVALLCGPAVSHASEPDSGRGSIELRHHAVRISSRAKPSANILRNGNLLIGANLVALTPAQRILTLRYYLDARAVAAAGKAVAKAGGWMGLKVIGSLFSALWHDNSAIVDRTAHSQQARLEARLRNLCARMSALRTVQDRLAAAQPAFAPYVYLHRSDVSDCLKGVSRSSH